VQRKPFLLRLDPQTHEALQRWADAELRSLNAQIEFLLRDALRQEGRLKTPDEHEPGRGSRKRPGAGEE
jgi:hypothetical protein